LISNDEPNKRSSLEVLTKKRLVQLARMFELGVPASHAKAEFVDALGSSEKASFAAILAELNRAELKDICRAHELDDSGKEKAVIAARILGTEPATKTSKGARKVKKTKTKTKKTKKSDNGNGGVLGFEAELFEMADQLWTNSGLQPSEYSTPVLALVFLKYADHKFEQAKKTLEAEHAGRRRRRARQLSIDDYLARDVVYVPEEARFQTLLELPEGADLGKAVNDAMKAIERANPELEDVLPKTYAKFESTTLASLLKIFANIPPESPGDIFGRIYEYFLGNFAPRTLQKGGEYFTPESVVKLIVEIVEPFHGRILDPACGSGGMFVQSARFVQERKKNPAEEISIYGIEKISQTLRLAKMNLAVHGLRGDIKEANSYYEDPHDCVGKFDFVMANPPFNQSAVDKGRIKDDARRFPFAMPKIDNANFLWIQLFASALGPDGRAGFVMANSAATASGSEGDIRRQLVESDAVDVIVELTTNLFYTVTLPVTLWFLNKGKSKKCAGKTLLIDARKIFRQVDRAHREMTPQQSEFLGNIVRLYRGHELENRHGSESLLAANFPNGRYVDVPGLCKVATIEDIADHEYSLNPGRHVGIAEQVEVDDGDFGERFAALSMNFSALSSKARELESAITASAAALLRSEGRGEA